ncbi:MAG: DNA polymerase III subunit alpha [Candidatus Izemoplasma sp.]|nr:DNA polymerase III subunit alpha [Candidatus Izemoplasma sp.]
MSITPLQIETSYSMRGSNLDIDSLVLRGKELGYDTLVLTDYRLYGAIAFYKACKTEGITPIIGGHFQLEGFVTEQLNHIFVYAKEYKGYQHLLKLASLYALNNQITLDELKTYHQGCAFVIDTDHSEYKYFIQNDKQNELHMLRDFFTDHNIDIYLGLTDNDTINDILEKSYNLVPLVRVLYNQKEDASIRQTLQRIFSVESDRFEKEHYFISRKSFIDRYSRYPKSLDNLEKLVNKCRLELDFSKEHLPTYPHDKPSSKAYLKALVYAGLKRRLQSVKTNHDAYYERVNYELNVIDQMGYNDYFLIVWDFVKYAKQQGYLVGPGRGSAAASLVSYCLGITSIDSLQYDLVFERFLNPERITLPDIDIDLPDDKRDDVIEYVRDLYGLNRVASICTFGRFKIKSAIRETARVHGKSGLIVNQIIKETANVDSVGDLIKQSEKVQTIIENHPEFKDILQIASAIEELPKHVSTHAAGIILADNVLTQYTPLQEGLLGMMQSQYEAKDLESLGLLKIDFLGLRNLSIIRNTLNIIKDNTGQDINMYKIPLDDQKTMSLLNRGDTVGLFQLESRGMVDLIKKMDMKVFEDIVVVLALFRPGPMESIKPFLRRRFKQEKVTYLHSELKPILEPTNGIIVYQEQIIKIANIFAGYSLGEADILRRAVSKKELDALEQERQNFVNKAKQKGRDETLSHTIYDYIVKFANYGFNKAHSVAYARVAYWMAYLKANYSEYFIGVLMDSVIGSATSLKKYRREAQRLGLKVYPPSINQSGLRFKPIKQGLVFPLLGIKNLGRNTVKAILEERKKKNFTSFVDFVSRVHQIVNKRVIESLILVGACDEFDHSKRAMMSQLDDILGYSDYGAFIDQQEFVITPMSEFPYEEVMTHEKELLGFHLVTHPIIKYEKMITEKDLLTPTDITQDNTNQTVRLLGMVSRITEITTKKGDQMAFITIDDEDSELDGVLFPRTYQRFKNILEKQHIFLFLGKVEFRNKRLQYIIDKIHKMDQ